MPQRMKLPRIRGRHDSDPDGPRADEHSETYTARLDRILDVPATPEPSLPESTRAKRRPRAAG